MIVLDAANNSLIVNRPRDVGMTSVVSYWSIDASNVWTPKTFKLIFAVLPSGNSIPGDETILPGIVTGEVSRVVENIWLHILTAFTATGRIKVVLDVGGDRHNISVITHQTGSGALRLNVDDTYTLNRDGTFQRQLANMFHGTANPGFDISQNVN